MFLRCVDLHLGPPGRGSLLVWNTGAEAPPYYQVRVGIIGAGRISDLHAIEYRDNPDAEIVAVADVNLEQATKRARAWEFPQARTYADYRALLEDSRVNAVEILLPHNLHCEAAIAALDAGKHVSLQKPMTINIAEADRLVARAEASPNQLFKIFENFIFYPPVVKAKELVDSGAIGEPITIRIKGNPGVSELKEEKALVAELLR